MTEYFLDSSAWLEYLNGSDAGAKVCYYLEEEKAFTSTLCLAEVGAVLDARGVNPTKHLEYMQRMSTTLPPTNVTSIKAGPLRNKHQKSKKRFGLIDALLFCQAQEANMIFVTKDTDFENLPNVELLS